MSTPNSASGLIGGGGAVGAGAPPALSPTAIIVPIAASFSTVRKFSVHAPERMPNQLMPAEHDRADRIGARIDNVHAERGAGIIDEHGGERGEAARIVHREQVPAVDERD